MHSLHAQVLQERAKTEAERKEILANTLLAISANIEYVEKQKRASGPTSAPT